MVEIDLPIRTEGHTFVIIAGVDGAVPPQDIRVDTTELIEHDLRPVLAENDDMQVKFMERLTRDEREIVGMNSQYAIKVIIDPFGEVSQDPSGMIEVLKDRLSGTLEEHGFIVSGTTSMIA
jgi:hypothetical protein